jgi:dephospho-CoA kinase
MIIGVTGPICAGTNAVGEILRRRGFERLSLSDELREYMREHGIEINRENMRDTADGLRKEHGAGAMAIITIKKVKSGKDFVIEGIMNPVEIDELRKLGNFYLINVTAPVELRFKRMLKRARDPDEPKTLEGFIEWEKRDLGIGQPAHGLHRAECFEKADFVVVNDGSWDELKRDVFSIVESIKC